MKITIDTTLKTIKVEEQINFCELHKELKKILGEEYKEYTLLPIEQKWNSYPVYPYTYPSPIYVYPYGQPIPAILPYCCAGSILTTGTSPISLTGASGG